MGEKRLPRFPRKKKMRGSFFSFSEVFTRNIFFSFLPWRNRRMSESLRSAVSREPWTLQNKKDTFEPCWRKYDRNKFYGSPEFADRKRSQPLFSIFFPGRHVTIFSCGERRRREERGERNDCNFMRRGEGAEGEESIKKCWSLSSSFLFVPWRRVSSFAFGANPGLPSLPSFRRAGGTGFNKT